MVDGRTMDMQVRGMATAKGCDQSIAVEIPCKRQSNGDLARTREDTLLGRLRMPVEAGVRATLQSGSKHKTEDSRHPQAVSKFITVSTPPPGE